VVELLRRFDRDFKLLVGIYPVVKLVVVKVAVKLVAKLAAVSWRADPPQSRPRFLRC
jgi:hypothetical protein